VTTAADADAADEVLAAARDLIRAFGEHDTDGYFGCFAPDATFIFYTTAGRLDSRDQYRRLWQQWEDEDGFRVLSCRSVRPSVQVLGDTAVFTHEVTTVVRSGPGQQTLQERETIVFRREAPRWVAVHEHLSPQPE
jgi:ketosteroid isomerase-like protein